jgi:hypothetical protein
MMHVSVFNDDEQVVFMVVGYTMQLHKGHDVTVEVDDVNEGTEMLAVAGAGDAVEEEDAGAAPQQDVASAGAARAGAAPAPP